MAVGLVMVGMAVVALALWMRKVVRATSDDVQHYRFLVNQLTRQLTFLESQLVLSGTLTLNRDPSIPSWVVAAEAGSDDEVTGESSEEIAGQLQRKLERDAARSQSNATGIFPKSDTR